MFLEKLFLTSVPLKKVDSHLYVLTSTFLYLYALLDIMDYNGGLTELEEQFYPYVRGCWTGARRVLSCMPLRDIQEKVFASVQFKLMSPNKAFTYPLRFDLVSEFRGSVVVLSSSNNFLTRA